MRNEGILDDRANPSCPWPSRYTADNGISTEHQVSIFIAGLTALLQPSIVVETGTFEGSTTLRILQQLSSNGQGVLHAYEVDRENAARTKDRVERYEKQLVLRQATIQQQPPPSPIDLAFIDSSFKSRIPDLRTILPLMRPGGIILIHDTHFQPEIARAAIETIDNDWDAAYMEPWTPRGLLVAQLFDMIPEEG